MTAFAVIFFTSKKLCSNKKRIGQGQELFITHQTPTRVVYKTSNNHIPPRLSRITSVVKIPLFFK